MESFSVMFSNIMGVAILLVWLSGWMLILIGLILGRIYEKRYYTEVKILLINHEFNLDKCTNSIRNGYEVYRRHRFGFSGKKIVPICQDFVSNFRRGAALSSIEYESRNKLADRLEEVIKRLQYEEQFDDDKANEIIDDLKNKIDNDIIEQVKRKLTFLEAYHKGILSVKDIEILE